MCPSQATSPRPPGIPGSITLPINGAPGVASGNPLDIITGGVTGTNFYKSWYGQAAPQAPPPTQITPNALTDPSLADSGGSGGDKKLQLPTLPYAQGAPQDFLAQQGIPITSSTFSAAQSALEAKQRVEQLTSDVNTLEKANTEDQGDLVSKRNDLLKAQQDQTKAFMSLQDSAKSATESFAKTMGDATDGLADIGAKLDSDLGFSKGLPGLADNLVRFLANLATAPIQGVLAAIANPRGAGTPQQSYANYAVQNQAAPYSPGAAKAGESNRDFAHRVMQPFFEQQGLTVGDHAADKFGEHQNGALDIMVDSIAQGNKVLQQVLADPNVYGAIFNNQAYGYGQGPGARPYSGGNTGDPTQDHLNHVHAWYKPGGSNNITPGAAGLPSGGTIPTATPAPASTWWSPQTSAPADPPAPGTALPAPGHLPGGGSMLPGAGMPQAFGQGGTTPVLRSDHTVRTGAAVLATQRWWARHRWWTARHGDAGR